jgi:hypothetical protein
MKVRLRLKGLHASKSARKGDAPIYYFYAWRGGPRCNYPDGTPITDKTDPALATAYAKAHEDLKKRPVGTIDSLIDAFATTAGTLIASGRSSGRCQWARSKLRKSVAS